MGNVKEAYEKMQDNLVALGYKRDKYYIISKERLTELVIKASKYDQEHKQDREK